MIEYNGLIKAIKGVVNEYLSSIGLTDLYVGVVISLSPITVNVMEKLNIKGNMLIVPDFFKSETYRISGSDHSHTLTIDKTLKEGDIVQLLKVSGGKKFVIIGRNKNDT